MMNSKNCLIKKKKKLLRKKKKGLSALSLKPKTMKMNSVLTFGKYKNWTLKKVIYNDYKYVEWCIEEKIFTVTEKALDCMEDQRGTDLSRWRSAYKYDGEQYDGAFDEMSSAFGEPEWWKD